MMWQVEQAIEPSHAPGAEQGGRGLRMSKKQKGPKGEDRETRVPSRSMSHSCARDRMSSPSLASIVLMGFPLWSLK